MMHVVESENSTIPEIEQRANLKAIYCFLCGVAVGGAATFIIIKLFF